MTEVNNPLLYDGSLFDPKGAKDLQKEMSEAALMDAGRSKLTQADVDYTMDYIATWKVKNPPAAYNETCYMELMGWIPVDMAAVQASIREQVQALVEEDRERERWREEQTIRLAEMIEEQEYR